MCFLLTITMKVNSLVVMKGLSIGWNNEQNRIWWLKRLGVRMVSAWYELCICNVSAWCQHSVSVSTLSAWYLQGVNMLPALCKHAVRRVSASCRQGVVGSLTNQRSWKIYSHCTTTTTVKEPHHYIWDITYKLINIMCIFDWAALVERDLVHVFILNCTF